MTGLATFASKHEIKPKQLADAIDVSVAHAMYLLSGERNPSKDRIDQIIAFCRTFDRRVTYERLFGAEAA